MSSTEVHPTGAAVASLLAAAVGLLALGVVVLVTELSEGAKDAVFAIGRTWMPGAEGIGPYSGKQTVFLVVWLAAWGVLHVLLARRDMDVRRWFGLALGLVLVAGILIWPPTWHALGA